MNTQAIFHSRFIKQWLRNAWPREAFLSKAKAKFFSSILGRGIFAGGLSEACVFTLPLFSIQNICNPKQVFWRPNMNVDLFCCSCVSVAEACGNKLYRDTFCIKSRCEIMPQCMWPEPRYPGVLGKFFAQPVKVAP